jgi:hypothetical protein
LLSDRRIARDNVSKIMEAITTPPHATENWERTFPHTAIPNVSETADLITRYVHTAKPLLVQPLDIDMYIISLAEGLGGGGGLGISRAWRFQRTFAEHSPQRARLIRLLLDWCFLRKLMLYVFGRHTHRPRSRVQGSSTENHARTALLAG